MISDDTIAEALRCMASERGTSTFCPSETARALAEDWRPLMPEVRRVAAALCDAGELRCTQRGQPAYLLTARGPIRLSSS
ncbi:MAG: DUF3253 domain-containing protein [Verrucomicrobiaceae bacterium]|nr:DUF3253 domain-containing protein [Verrucomicrobiaceae bacterium]